MYSYCASFTLKGAFGLPGMLCCVPLIWLVAFTLAAPMVIWKKLEYWTEWPNLTDLLRSERYGKSVGQRLILLHWTS